MNTPMTQRKQDRLRNRRISVSSLVDLLELTEFSLTLVTTRGDAVAAASVLGSALGITAGAVVGTMTGHEKGIRVLCLGPGRWLVRDTRETSGLIIPDNTATFDLSDAWRLFQISGIAARRLLASGCPLDLNPARFASGQCASTRLDEFRVILCCVTPDTYELYVERSYCEDLRARLVLRAAGLSAPAEMEA